MRSQREIVVADRAAARLEAAGEWLRRQSSTAEVLLVAPSRGAADDLIRRYGPRGGILGVRRLTLLQLATELATLRLAAEGSAPLGGLAVEALTALAVARARSEASLAYLDPVADAPGFVRALAATLGELREHRLGGSELAGLAPTAHDLGRILEVFRDQLEERGLADRARLFTLGAEVAPVAASPAGLPTLLLDLPAPTPVEATLLRALAARAPAVIATVPSGDDEGVGRWRRILAVEPRVVEGGPPRVRLERLRTLVFAPDFGAPSEEPPAPEEDPSVNFFAAPGEGREAVEVARRIRALAAEGVPLDDMAVALRAPGSYGSLLEDAFSRAGVPVYFSHGTVRPDPAGRALLALLACAAEDCSASRFAEYLSLGQVPALDADGAPPRKEVPWVEPRGDQLVLKSLADAEVQTEEEPGRGSEGPEGAVIAGTLRAPRYWERLLVDAAVVGGRERWERRLRGLERELEKRLREIESPDDPPAARIVRQLERLRHLERFALPLVDFLASWPVEASWGGWLERLQRLSSMAVRRPETVLAVLAELEPMSEVGPVTLAEVRRVLAERLTDLRSDPPDRRYGRVFVGSVEELRGRSFRAVFLPGLAEGVFPRKTFEDPLLLDAAREQIGDLATQHRRVAEERLLLRLAIGAAEERLVASYPSLDILQGRARVFSFYALDLLRAAEGALPELERLEQEAVEAAASHLGWPAPRDPERAVDAAEYDLAWLKPALRAEPRASRGRGRYLLEVNSHLARSLRSRARRWRNFFGEDDGLVAAGDSEALEVLQQHRLRSRSFSPTALERYAACPYRFALYAIFRLREREVSVRLEKMDPLTRGSLFHEVQFRLFRKLRERRLLPMRQRRMEEILTLADGVLDATAGEYRDELAPAVPRVWQTEVETLRTDLRGWIRRVVEEVDREDGRWVPTHFELAFGLRDLEGRDPASDPQEAITSEGFRLRGAIDLVEVEAEGPLLRVTDHKTGKAPRNLDLMVDGGRRLQPLLYAVAAEVRLDRPAAEGRLFFCTQRGEYARVTVPVTEGSRQTLAGVLETVDRAVERGFLPAAPAEGECRYCDYRLVCGPYEEVRVARKRQDDLGELLELRKLE